MDGWGVSTFGWGVYSVLPNIVTFVVTRVGGTQRAPTILFFEPGTRVMRRKVSGAVVDERRDPSATGQGPRRRWGGGHGGDGAGPRRRLDGAPAATPVATGRQGQRVEG